jgi:molybdopterin-guanine dinucleotide biosynthesis protein A
MMDRGWTAVVLAGGRSSRMGRDKALIEVDGVTLLELAIERLRPHAREVLVIGDPEKYVNARARTIPDDLPGQGPLGGIVTALRHARYVRLLVTACDMPALNDRLFTRLKKQALDLGGDAVVPRHPQGIEPLSAVYHKHCIEVFDRRLQAGEPRMSSALEAVDVRFLDLVPGEDGWPADLFRNINAPSDL